MKSNTNKAPIFAISRLRMGTDGAGITTLVTFMGCPLRCKYCLNEKCHEPILTNNGQDLQKGVMLLSPTELYDLVKIDNLYFQSTGGGICFGGGEPTLYPEFIEEFKSLCGDKWKITLETSLHCSYNVIHRLSKVVDYWFVDIKSMDSEVYFAYTDVRSAVEQHLISLKQCVPNERITIKVPIIPGFSTENDAERTVKEINVRFEFSNIIPTQYIIKHHE